MVRPLRFLGLGFFWLGTLFFSDCMEIHAIREPCWACRHSPFGLGFRFYIELLGISSLGLFGWRGGLRLTEGPGRDTGSELLRLGFASLGKFCRGLKLLALINRFLSGLGI